MAKKDFDEYVVAITKQHKEFQNTLETLSKEAQEGMTDFDYIENLKKQIEPFNQNYERVLYLKFLLDKPTKKEKRSAYLKRCRKQLEKLNEKNNPDKVLDENKKILENLK